MDCLVRHLKPILILMLATGLILFFAGPSRETIAERSFVGKWRSSRLWTPLYIYVNGEWEIKKDDGAILQYGVWQYKDEKIFWSYKVGQYVKLDVNEVLSATPGEFQVKESDGTTTTFTLLDRTD